MFILALATIKHELLERVLGPKAGAYGLLGIATVLWIISRVLIEYIPPRLVIIVGVIGWILTFSLLYWFYCFGPGAFGHH